MYVMRLSGNRTCEVFVKPRIKKHGDGWVCGFARPNHVFEGVKEYTPKAAYVGWVEFVYAPKVQVHGHGVFQS